ncbi:hypothetical protein [Actinomyces faecalis]|uniref:hypothetical protein n=1 Tax=Actinomyces faecalis TaxID=2722820 RepID=UPI00155533EA|nr:hypothetical protein [Actinomyces faecalis]
MSTRLTVFERALDKALELPARRIEENVAHMRREYPGADVAELARRAADRFRTESGLTSGAVGASAALPAVGTGTAAVLTVGQTTVFLASAVKYVLTVAELQGMRVVTPDKRRALVLSALLGQDGAEAIQGSLGLSTLYWAAQSLAQMPMPTVRSINAQLVKRLARHQAVRGGALVLGRLLPFGIGAAIGWSGGRALANQVIEGAQAALGPAPLDTDDVEVIEA